MKSNQKECLALLEQIRWGGTPQCPYCESLKSRKLKNEYRYQCNECFTSYSVTVGTLFHKTHVDLEKWFLAIHLLNSPKPLSVRKLAKEIGVNKNTAHYIITRIRQAMQDELELLQRLIQTNEFK
ncbi:MAG TPA: IS1595 family transposase [Stenomitos sp.]